MIVRQRAAMLRIAPLYLIAAMVFSAEGVAQQADSLPEGVTPETIAQGKTLYQGAGICAACHGPDGTGASGPDLTDAEWLHSDGSYEAIVEQILAGVSADSSKSGIPMLPKGGSQLDDDQVRAVAAYVWSLRQAESP